MHYHHTKVNETEIEVEYDLSKLRTLKLRRRVLLLCLVGCVPILNFAISGYCIRWGRELSFGKRAEMPKTIFRKKEISTGFFALLISLGLGFACGLVFMVGFLLLTGFFGSLNPTIGLVVAIILLIAMTIFIAIMLTPLVDACIMRMSVLGYLEAGFNVKTVLKAFRKSPGSLIGASLVPRIIVGVVAFIVALLIMLLFGLLASLAGAAISNDPTGFANRVSSNPILVRNMTSGGVFLMLLGYLLSTIISAMFNVFAELFAARAVGHWVSRNAPEWASESEEGAPVEDVAETAI